MSSTCIQDQSTKPIIVYRFTALSFLSLVFLGLPWLILSKAPLCLFRCVLLLFQEMAGLARLAGAESPWSEHAMSTIDVETSLQNHI